MFKQKNPLSRFYEEVINQGRLEVLEEIYADNYVNYIAPFGLEKGVDIETIVDGKITEHDGAEDTLFLLQQIGAVKESFIL